MRRQSGSGGNGGGGDGGGGGGRQSKLKRRRRSASPPLTSHAHRNDTTAPTAAAPTANSETVGTSTRMDPDSSIKSRRRSSPVPPVSPSVALGRIFDLTAPNSEGQQWPTNDNPHNLQQLPQGMTYRNIFHPILGMIRLPTISAEGEEIQTNDKVANSHNDSSNIDSSPIRQKKDSIDFRSSLGIKQDDIRFPSMPNSTEAARGRRKGSGKHMMGDGLLVPISALAWPSGSNSSNQGDAKPHATKTNDYNATAAAAATEHGLSAAKLESEKATKPDDEVRGEICIITEKGATIREQYDIDEAQHNLGRLQQHDRRFFVEKRWLPPPPPVTDADDEDEEEDECVGVMRYRIVLSCTEPGSSVNGGKTYKYGWISDRGRLKNEPYTILRLSNIN